MRNLVKKFLGACTKCNLSMQREKGLSVAYILGCWTFWGLYFFSLIGLFLGFTIIAPPPPSLPSPTLRGVLLSFAPLRIHQRGRHRFALRE